MADAKSTRRERRNEWQRNHRKLSGNADTRKYEKSPRGFLMRLYRNMQSRVLGIQKQKQHLYAGKSLLSRDEFYEWASLSQEFPAMFEVWRASGWDRRLTPTVDRIDSSRGYEIDNMQWLTHSENSRRGTLSRFGKAA